MSRTVPLRVLICPQEFKGSMDAARATAIMAAAVRDILPTADFVEQPMADGGPDTAALVGHAMQGSTVRTTVHDAYGALIEATYTLFDGPPLTAAIDSAEAVGLSRTAEHRRDLLRSSSRGIGELIVDAARHGARRIILGVGGTASSDGGAGAARALGLGLFDPNGDVLPDAAVHLARLARIEGNAVKELQDATLNIAVDVRNPLTGPRGAVAVYGRQKGLRDWQAPALDIAIARWALTVRRERGRDVDAIEGAGAGGGIPAGILAILPHATIESGAELVGETVGLPRLVETVDLVITGEGSLDAQTASGKSVAYVAALAARAGVPCLAVAGAVESRPEGIVDAEALVQPGEDPAHAIAHPEPFVTAAVRRLVERWLASEGIPGNTSRHA